MRKICSLVAVVAFAAPAMAAEELTAHVKVSYSNIEPAYAKAMARTLEAARKAYAEQYKFDIPKTVQLTIECEAGKRTQLYTDGDSRMFLSIPSKEALARPAQSGVFHLYGLCHELGHIAMYRTLKNRDWLKGDAAEGWAHYAGSAVVDAVYAAEGADLWPDKYDYRQDGTARLKKQLGEPKPGGVAAAAGQWLKLEGVIGKAGFVDLFTAWNDADLDASKPSVAADLQKLAVDLWPDKSAAINAWWQATAPLLIEMRPASDIKPVTTVATRLTGQPITLKYDDDTKDGQKSVAGGGHARKFVAPDGEWYVRGISVFGGRYGQAQAPAENFDVALCDEKMRTIAMWKKPYSAFQRGEPKWTPIQVTPTRVPKEFYICLDFHPTATKGVYVAFDASTKGGSKVAQPGKPGSPFDSGDWMIRIMLDRLKPAASGPAQGQK